jgi:UDP-N-acetyl-D-galactosamine dehydrogenase
MSQDHKIAIIGLGYVGLPLAVGMAEHYPNVIGFDIDPTRIQEIRDGYDRTEEITPERLRASRLAVSRTVEDLKDYNLYIVTVPTPVDEENQPDLTPMRLASETVAQVLKKGDIVVYESTVYPGVTEDLCGKILEQETGLICGQDFMLGYSPERINPGDRTHTLQTITKVVAGQTPDITDILAEVYGVINGNKIFKAASIKVAEAAKVIENAQRDINIAFVNEVAVIFSKLGISVYDVLEAASTKWNFLNFAPGLVGGHCIGVDPYYLAECSMKLGHVPKVILAGREMNDQMAHLIATRIEKRLPALAKDTVGRILILGLTFKEDVPDLRNTKVVDIVHYFKQRGYEVDIYDPHADAKQAQEHYNLHLLSAQELDAAKGRYSGVIAAVPHREFIAQKVQHIQNLLIPGGLIADLKAIWRDQVPSDINYWTL